MKKIVFVIGPLSPRAQNGNCIIKLLRFFGEDSFSLHIIYLRDSLREEIKSADYNAEFYPLLTKKKEKRLILESNCTIKNSLKNRFLLFSHRVFYYMKNVLSKSVIDNNLVKTYYNELQKINNIDYVIPVCWPFEALCAANKFSEDYGVKFFPILFDKFTTSDVINYGKLSRILKFKRQFNVENYIFCRAEHLIATYDWEKYLSSFYNQLRTKITYIEPPCLEDYIGELQTLQSRYSFYGGMLDMKMRNPKNVLKIIEKINEEDFLWKFAITGNCSSLVNKFSNKNKNIINLGTVSRNDFNLLLRNASFLISIGNKDITQTPSKIFQYIATSKPIIHFYFDNNDRCLNILKKYPNSICLDANDIPNSSKDLASFIRRNNFISLKSEAIKNIYEEACPSYTAKVILNQIK